jgi:hypothetical protein
MFIVSVTTISVRVSVLKLTNAGFNYTPQCSILALPTDSWKLNLGPADQNQATFREFPHSGDKLK